MGVLNYKKMPKGGIEPPTQGFSGLCSTNWATLAYSSLFFGLLRLSSYIYILNIIYYLLVVVIDGLELLVLSAVQRTALTNWAIFNFSSIVLVVVIDGLEPSASSLSETRSNQLSYMTITYQKLRERGTRTRDLWFPKPAL